MNSKQTTSIINHRSSTIDHQPLIILVRPQMGENIGAAARIMANFGLEELRLVAPRDGWPDSPLSLRERVRVRAATNSEQASPHPIPLPHTCSVGEGANGGHINFQKAKAMAAEAPPIYNATTYPTLAEAVADCHAVYATTARSRKMAIPFVSPRELMEEVTEKAEQNQRIAFVFGPERSGLDNDELTLADKAVSIPVSPEFPSLNLAQAVAVLGYEYATFIKMLPLRGGADEARARAPEAESWGGCPAPKADLLGLFTHLEESLEKSGFFKSPEMQPTVMRNLRALLQRANLSSQETQTLRGVITSLTRSNKPSEK